MRFNANLVRNPQSITDPRFAYGLWLSSWSNDRIAVGEYICYPAASATIKKLRGLGGDIYYPFPERYSDGAHSRLGNYGFLLMILTREQLAQAAKLLETSPMPSPQQTSGAKTRVYVPARSLRE